MSSSYWPADINAVEVLAPIDILREVGAELEERTNKILTTEVADHPLADRHVLKFVVRHRTSQRSLDLFQVVGSDKPYPVVIEPPRLNLPEFLKRRPKSGDFRIMAAETLSSLLAKQSSLRPVGDKSSPEKFEKGTGLHKVDLDQNQWLCVTPEEFQAKLKKLLALDEVRSLVVSLMASKSAAS